MENRYKILSDDKVIFSIANYFLRFVQTWRAELDQIGIWMRLQTFVNKLKI
jgi:hypothetical protein